MPIIRSQFGGRHGGLLGGLFSRRGLGCACQEQVVSGLGQDPGYGAPGIPAGIADNIFDVGPVTATTTTPSTVATAATPTSIGAGAASSLNDFIYNLDTTWVWIAAAGAAALFFWKKKK